MVVANVVVSVVKHFGDYSGDCDVKSTFLAIMDVILIVMVLAVVKIVFSFLNQPRQHL